MYRVTFGGEPVEVTDAEARNLWDEHPPELRTGKRDCAFILWEMDEIGRRRSPLICKPIPESYL